MTEYKKRTMTILAGNPKTLEKIAMFRALQIAFQYDSLEAKDLSNLNPKWVKNQIKVFSKMQIIDHMMVIGKPVDYGFFKIKKSKAGYILYPNWQWRLKSEEYQLPCIICGKQKPLNIKQRCKSCKGKRIKWSDLSE